MEDMFHILEDIFLIMEDIFHKMEIEISIFGKDLVSLLPKMEDGTSIKCTKYSEL